MAKGKHSRALFEVIKQTQEQQRRGANIPKRSSSWFDWLKRSATPGAKPKVRVSKSTPPVMRELQPPIEHAADAFDVTEDVTTRSHSETESELTTATMRSHVSDDDRDESTPRDESISADDAGYTAEESATADASVASADMEPSEQPSLHDTAITAAITDEPAPVRSTAQPQTVHFTLSYASLGMIAAAVCMLLVVAFLAGRQLSPRVVLTGPSIEQLQQGRSSPEVLNLKNTPPEATVSRGVSEAAKPPEPKKVEQPQTESAVSTASPTPDRRRIGGRNYIIAQSYPDPDNAEKASALLRKNNIPVTVEQLDAAPGWFCVVTEVGFDRVSSPDCERYQKLIKDLNVQAKTARVKAFEPYLYKWK